MKKSIEEALKEQAIEYLDVGSDALYVPSKGVVITFHSVKDVTVETDSGLKFSVLPPGALKPSKKPRTKARVKEPKPVPPTPPKVVASDEMPKSEKKPRPRPKEPLPETPMAPGDALVIYLKSLTRTQVWSAIELTTNMEVKQAIPDLIIPCTTAELIAGFIRHIESRGILSEEHRIIKEIKDDILKQQQRGK